jgi:hypothetical protein
MLNTNQIARWTADRRRQSKQNSPDDQYLGNVLRLSRGEFFRRKNNGVALRTFLAVKANPHTYNPAPADRVLLVCSFDGVPGPWLPVWRVAAPGYGHAEHCTGDAYTKFQAFWRVVAWAIMRWDHMGRPGPVYSHLSPADQAWLTEEL